MAVQQGYGKMAGIDALVFAYDTGDTVNSYKGEPTTNLNADPLHSTRTDGETIGLSNWGGDTGYGEFKVNTSPVGGGMMFINHNTSDPAGSGGTYTDFPATRYTLEEGKTYTRSWYAKAAKTQSISGHVCSCNRDSTNTYIVGGSITVTPEWQRYTHTFTYEGPTSTDWQFRHIIYENNSVYIANVQLEEKSHETPFVNGTRSVTEGLKDLTGNQVIELADISFDSNGKITFDGITNYIDCGDIVRGRETFSAESWVKTEDVRVGANGSYKNPSIFGTQHGSGASGDFALCVKSGNLGYYAELGSTGYRDSGVFIADNIWHHLAVTKDLEGIIKLYVDGVEVYSRTGNTALLRTTDLQQYHWEVGRAYWRGEDSTMLRFNGDIATHRFYDRALSASEILANYNNQKTRFNIL